MPDLLEYLAYPPGMEPDCDVMVDGIWCPGYVRGWFRHQDGWRASVQYSREQGSNYLSAFGADHLRRTAGPVRSSSPTGRGDR